MVFAVFSLWGGQYVHGQSSLDSHAVAGGAIGEIDQFLDDSIKNKNLTAIQIYIDEAVKKKDFVPMQAYIDRAIKNKDSIAIQMFIDELVKNKKLDLLDLIFKNITYVSTSSSGVMSKPFIKALYSYGADVIPRVFQEIVQTPNEGIAADLVPVIVHIKGKNYSDFYREKIDGGIDERTASRLIAYATTTE